MPAAAHVADTTNHGRIVVGPGVPSVLIAGMSDLHSNDIYGCSAAPVAECPTVETGG